MFDDDYDQPWYDTRQICLNGHLINDKSEYSPLHNKDYCDRCGAKTITQCQNCNAKIPGYYHSTKVWSIGDKYVPSYCVKCGKPYPWTETRLNAAKKLAEEVDGLTGPEKKQLKESIDDLAKDTPNATLAATRFKGLMIKVGKEAAGAFRDILVDIASETAKKAIWGS